MGRWNFDERRALIAVLREAGFPPTARRLHLGQPALSQVVGSSERQLGVVLVARSRSGTTPTEAD
jgi:DNA-binding transcriptional LysR family regulator